MNPYKERFARRTKLRTLAEALEGADAFVGVASARLVTGEMLKTMARDPIVFAMANPVPEISPEEARAARPDVIMATGRSDYPNQINNVLGFPFIFRGTLDVRATAINEQMKLAASHALAALAKEDVPDSVVKAYGGKPFKFGRDYIIPKPFDYRVLLWEAPAVAKAAMETGVAKRPIKDWDAYVRQLEARLFKSRSVLYPAFAKAKAHSKKIVFPEGENDKIVRAAKIAVDEGLAKPILLGSAEVIVPKLKEFNLPIDKVEVIDPKTSDKREAFARKYAEVRKRKGASFEEAKVLMNHPNYFGCMMVEEGLADGLLSGLTMPYPDTIRPALLVNKTRPDVKKVAGLYMLILKDRIVCMADTTVNVNPTAEELAEVAKMAAECVRSFDIEPRIAFISYSNFGTNTDPEVRKVQQAVELAKRLCPDTVIEGEMQVDPAVNSETAKQQFPWSAIQGDANVLIFPTLDAANAAYKLVWRLSDAEAIGPILMGVSKPVHILQRGVEVNDIVNMIAVCAADAVDRGGPAPAKAPRKPKK
jgi:malate dehydrogenase (oxaloacetate-decarboxylating)(NADP+)